MRCNVSYVNYLASFRFLFERPELADQSRPASGPDSGPALIQRPLRGTAAPPARPPPVGQEPSFPTRSKVLCRRARDWRVSGELSDHRDGLTRPPPAISA